MYLTSHESFVLELLELLTRCKSSIKQRGLLESIVRLLVYNGMQPLAFCTTRISFDSVECI